MNMIFHQVMGVYIRKQYLNSVTLIVIICKRIIDLFPSILMQPSKYVYRGLFEVNARLSLFMIQWLPSQWDRLHGPISISFSRHIATVISKRPWLTSHQKLNFTWRHCMGHSVIYKITLMLDQTYYWLHQSLKEMIRWNERAKCNQSYCTNVSINVIKQSCWQQYYINNRINKLHCNVLLNIQQHHKRLRASNKTHYRNY